MILFFGHKNSWLYSQFDFSLKRMSFFDSASKNGLNPLGVNLNQNHYCLHRPLFLPENARKQRYVEVLVAKRFRLFLLVFSPLTEIPVFEDSKFVPFLDSRAVFHGGGVS
jgi:hypothetical protein